MGTKKSGIRTKIKGNFFVNRFLHEAHCLIIYVVSPTLHMYTDTCSKFTYKDKHRFRLYNMCTHSAISEQKPHSGCFCWPGRREQCRLFAVAFGRDGHRSVLSETAIITLRHLVGVVYQKQSGGSVSDRLFREET